MSRLTLLPAVDVAAGRAAQVVDPTATRDPLTVARAWVDAGAELVHLVDLDRAYGRGTNLELLARIIDALPVPVQLSGGLTDRRAVEEAAATGARHLVLASALLADPDLVGEFVETYGDRVVPAVDVRAGRVVSRGTDLDLGPLETVLEGHPAAVPGPTHLLVADAGRDGSRRGSDTDLFRRVAGLTHADLIASGGVAGPADLRALAALPGECRVRRVVLGAALYHGMSFSEAQEAAR